MLSTLLTVLQILIGLFLIFIIMLQRGKGGGLVGALGGMGGASAFGPKADVHVLKLTIGLAIAWVVIACSGIYANREYKRGNIGLDAEIPKKVDVEAESDETSKDAGGPTADTPVPGGKDVTKTDVTKTDVTKTKDEAATNDKNGTPPSKTKPAADEKVESKTEKPGDNTPVEETKK